MSISTTTNRVSYIGTALVSSYSYTFKIFDATHIRVIVSDTTGTETVLTYATDYTLTGVGERTGGTIVLVNASQAWLTAGKLKTGYTLVARRVVPLKQETDIRNQGSYLPEVHEDEFDKLVMADQQQQDALDRSFTLSETVDPANFSPILPANLVGQASVVIGTNPTGNGLIAGPTFSQISGAATSASSAATSATAAAGSATTAAGQAALAALWAAQFTGTVVNFSDYSSKEWAIGSPSGGSAKSWAQAAAASASSNIYAYGGTSGGSANTQTLTPSSALVSYSAGIGYRMIAGFTNTGAMTLNVSGLGAKNVLTQSGAALTAGEFVAGRIYNLVYDGTQFVVAELSSPEDSSVTNPKLANVPAATVKGNSTSVSAVPTDLTSNDMAPILGGIMIGGMNFLANGAFDYWQRGTSTTVANGATSYQADRWYAKNSLGTNGVITYAQVAGTSTGSKYGASVKITTAPTAAQANGCEFYQTLENFQSLSLLGQVATFSAKVKAQGNVTSVGLQFYYKTSEGKVDTSIGTEATCTVSSSGFATCTVPTITLTAATITSSGVVGVRIRILGVSTGNTYDINNGFIVEQGMLNIGSLAAGFSRQYKNPKDEYADALRWYETGTCFQQQYTIGSSGLSYGSDKTYATPKRTAATPTLSLTASSNLTGGVLSAANVSVNGFTVAVGAGSTGTSYFYQVTFTSDASI